MDLGIADHAFRSHGFRPRFELRLDQGDSPGAGGAKSDGGGKNNGQADETRVTNEYLNRIRNDLWRQMPGIRFFMDYHSRITSQLPGQLPVANIDGVHFHRSICQQHVGETAGGGANIRQTRPAGDNPT